MKTRVGKFVFSISCSTVETDLPLKTKVLRVKGSDISSEVLGGFLKEVDRASY
jgi:hypothetical protein